MGSIVLSPCLHWLAVTRITAHVSSVYSNILLRSSTGKLYVTHVNGKLQVRFCTVNLSGVNGSNTINLTASGTITAQ